MNQKLSPWKVSIFFILKNKKFTHSSVISFLLPHLYFHCYHSIKVIQCMGKKSSSATPGSGCLVLQCRLLPVHQFIEMDAALNTNTFMSIHSPDMKFTYCHTRYNLMDSMLGCIDECWGLLSFTPFSGSGL